MVLIKRCLTAFVTLVITQQAIAQSNVPSTTQAKVGSAGGSVSVYTPGSYTSGIYLNSIQTFSPLQPYSSEASVISSSRTVSEVNRTIQYFDGLGRPIQAVNWQASPAQKDMVATVAYDLYGREAYQFLPYTATSNDGLFKTNPFSDQLNFYTTSYNSQQAGLTNEAFFYGHTIYEASPLNRPLKSFAPGNNWAGSEGGTEHAVQMQYLVNSTSDSVRIWTISNNNLTYSGGDVSTNIPSTSATYSAGQLFKNVTIDEKGNSVVEYKDKDGHVVLKKVQIESSPGTAHIGWLNTYYVYDDFGNLRFVIPPKAIQTLLANASWDLSTGSNTIINELSFRYEYDGRNRMTAKKVPGAGWVYLIYDQRDRLVFTQDANLGANNQWMYTLYDGLNRAVQTGIMTDNISPSSLQSYVDANTGSNSSSTVTTSGSFPPSIPANLDITERQTGRTTYHATNQITFSGEFSSESTAEYVAEIVTGSTGSFSNGVTVLDNPIPSGTNPVALTYTYYDDYSVTGKTYSTTDNSKLGIGANPYGETLPSASSNLVRGMATVTRVRVIENPADLTAGAWMETASFYDDNGRVIQTNADNYKGGLDVSTNRYDFTGKVISNYLLHTNPADSSVTVRVRTNMDYDHGGRLLTLTKQINDNDSTLRTTLRNSYDAMGQLLRKRSGQKSMTDTAALNNEDYSYNIRGWLKGMNWSYGASSGPSTSQMNISTSKWFAMDLSYDWGYGSNEYNGNIAGQRWVSGGDGEERSFGYGYDKANRLLFADFNQNFSGSWAKSSGSFGIDYSVLMGDGSTAGSAYDANGNILAMQQKGLKLNASSTIDNLTYSYNTNSNKLANVADAITADQKLGDFTDNNTSGDDYGYDGNGNLLKDRNKSIGDGSTSGISYNHLNLPYLITVTGKGTIKYIYDATGNKLEKITKDTVLSSKTTTTDYLNGFVYENNTLQFFGHEEGRVRMNHAVTLTNPTVFNYDYFIKDHLGNTRVVLTDEQDISTYPAATLEDGAVSSEQNYYDINTGKIVSNPASLPSTYQNNNGNPPYNPNTNVNPTATSAKMYVLNGATGDKMGLSFAIKVMAGDNVSIFAKSFWHGSSPSNSYPPVVSDLLTILAGTSAVTAASHGTVTAAALTGSSVTPTELSSFLSTAPVVSGRPNAYLNWILFDEQFRPVSASSGFDAVNTSADALKTHNPTVSITKSGFLYIFVSNASDQDVFFDNLQVIHTKGPLLEETHYYPFGLTMAGISSKAAGKLENRYKYNGGSELQHQEFSDGSGLEMYDTHFRQLDPQLGRWWQVDPKPNYDESPYASMGNNPILHNDLLGDTVVIRYYHNNMRTEVEYKNGMISPRNSDKVLKDDGSFSIATVSDLNKVAYYDKDLKSKLETMENSNQMHYIEQQTETGKSNANTPESPENDKNGIPTGSTTKYNPWAKTNVRGDKRDPKVGLAHELLGHGFDSDQGKTDFSKTANGIPMYEVSGVKAENKVRAKTGDPKKTTYGGQPIPAVLLEDPKKKRQ